MMDDRAAFSSAVAYTYIQMVGFTYTLAHRILAVRPSHSSEDRVESSLSAMSPSHA